MAGRSLAGIMACTTVKEYENQLNDGEMILSARKWKDQMSFQTYREGSSGANGQTGGGCGCIITNHQNLFMKRICSVIGLFHNVCCIRPTRGRILHYKPRKLALKKPLVSSYYKQDGIIAVEGGRGSENSAI